MKKTIHLLLLVILTVANKAQAQYSVTSLSFQTVTKSLGNITCDNGGNTIVTGQFMTTLTIGSTTLTNSNPDPGFNFGGNSGFIAKKASNGTWLWMKNIGVNSYSPKPSCSPTIGDAQILSVTTDAGGNIYITGSFKGSVSFDNITLISFQNGGGACASYWYDIFTAKMSPTGTFLWAKKEGTNASSGEFGNSVTTDLAGNVYTTGNFFQKNVNASCPGSNTISQHYAYVVKYNSTGTKVWEKKYAGNSADCSNIIHGRRIVSDGTNVFVLGNLFGTVSFGGAYSFSAGSINNSFLLKLDGAGNTIWAKTVSGVANNPMNLLLDNNNADVYITGSAQQGTLNFGNSQSLATLASTSYFLSRYSAASGNCSWAANPGTIAVLSIGDGLVKQPSGNIAISTRDASNSFSIDEFSPVNGALVTSTVATNMVTGSSQPFSDLASTSNGLIYSQNLKGAYDFGGITIASSQAVNSSYGDMLLVEYVASFLRKAETAAGTLGANKLSVYPNPIKDILYITSSTETNIGKVHIYDQTGRKVFDTDIAKKQAQLNLSSLAPGFYYIKSEHQTEGTRIIKK
jgi:hypothetical protein